MARPLNADLGSQQRGSPGGPQAYSLGPLAAGRCSPQSHSPVMLVSVILILIFLCLHLPPPLHSSRASISPTPSFLPDILEECFSISFDVLYKLHLISCLGISDLE